MTHLTHESFYLLLYGAVIPLLMVGGIGIFISLLQALLQIQEQSVPFLAKIISLTIYYWVFSGLLSGRFIALVQHAFLTLSKI